MLLRRESSKNGSEINYGIKISPVLRLYGLTTFCGGDLAFFVRLTSEGSLALSFDIVSYDDLTGEWEKVQGFTPSHYSQFNSKFSAKDFCFLEMEWMFFFRFFH